MAGSRMVRKGFVDSDRVSRLESWFTECFFHRLLLVADDFGFYDARPAYLRAQLFCTKLDKVREADVSRALLECERAGLIRFYEVDSKPYLEILRYGQRCDKTKPKWPTPPDFAGVSGKFREIPAIAGAGDGVKEKSGKKENAAVGGDAPEVPAPTPDGFAAWLEMVRLAHPSASKGLKLPADVLKAAKAAYGRFPEAAEHTELLTAYFKDGRLAENRFYAPRGQRKFFEDLEDVVAHAERWRKWAGWKPKKKATEGYRKAEVCVLDAGCGSSAPEDTKAFFEGVWSDLGEQNRERSNDEEG